MVPFGFGVSDFIAVGHLAAKIAKALSENSGATATYGSLIALLQSIFVLVGQTTSYLSSSPSTVQVKLDPPTLNALRYHLECSQQLMTQFLVDSKNYTESILKGKPSSIRAQLRKIQWTVFKEDDARKLEQRLQTHLNAAQIFLSVIISKSQSEASHSHFEIASRTELKIDILNQKVDQMLVCRQTTERNIPHIMGYPWETEIPIFFEDVFGRCHRLPQILCRDGKTFCDTLCLLFRSMVDHDGIGRWEDYEVVDDRTMSQVLNRRQIEHQFMPPSSLWCRTVQPGEKLAMNIVRTQKIAANPDALIPLLPKDRNCPKCGTICPGTKLSPCRSCKYTFGISVEERRDDRSDFFSRETDLQVWSDTSLLSRPESRPNGDFRQSTESLEDSQTDWNVQASFDYSNAIFPAPRNEENAFMRVRYVTQYMVPSRNWQSLDRNQRQDFSRNPLSHAAAQCDIKWAREILCNTGTDPNASDGESLTPLARICWDPKGDFEAVIKLLIKHGADVNASTSWDVPLSIATGRGDIALVGLLLRLGADANAAGSLQTACQGGHVEIVRILLAAGAHVNTAWDQISSTPLQEACREGHVEIVRILLAAGAHVNAKFHAATPLHEACQGGHVEIARMLLAAGANIKSINFALKRACRRGHANIARMLIDAGAEINANPTALQAACAGGHIDIIRMLITAGADVKASPENQYDLTALQAACESRDMTSVKLLIDAGARVNDPSETHARKTALAAAIIGKFFGAPLDQIHEPGDEENVISLVRYLIEQGADVHDCSYEMTALQAAASTKQIRVLEELLRLGADVNQTSIVGLTALQAAVNIEVMKLLLDHGADVNAIAKPSGSLSTALQSAAYHKHEEAVRLLVDSYGALVNVSKNEYCDVTPLEASISALPYYRYHGLCADRRSTNKVKEEAKVEVVTAFLLQRSAECTPRALKLAVESGYLNVVKLLLEYGKAAYGKDCMVGALENAVYSSRLTVVAYLLGRSVKPTPTCAHIAAYHGVVNILEMLLMHGAPIDKPAATVYGIGRTNIKVFFYWTGNTVLETALYHNKPKIVQFLQEWERDPQSAGAAQGSPEQAPVASRIQGFE